MKVRINRLLFFIMLISLMLYGILAEGVTMACLLMAIVLERNNVKSVVGKKYYRGCVLLVLAYIVLFLVHIFLLNQNNEEVIRLYGLTKNICFPVLMVLAFGYVCADKFPLRLVLLEMTVFNVIYTVAFLLRANDATVSFQLGSINGCSGISIVLIPAAVTYIRECRKYSRDRIKRDKIAYIFIVSTVVLVLVSESSTSQLLLLVEVLAYILSTFIKKIRIKQNIKGFMIIVVIGALSMSLLIATGRIALDPNELKTRAGIWTRAYNQFSIGTGLQIAFGTGNDIVHMLTKDLEPHNMFLEILLIHGLVGLGIITLFISYTLKKILKLDAQKLKPLMLAITVYIVICCLHPFYTGSTPYQFNCLTGLLFLFSTGKKESLTNNDWLVEGYE